MLSIIRAEHGNCKLHEQNFGVAFPVMTLVLAFLLTAGMSDAYAESVWNWMVYIAASRDAGDSLLSFYGKGTENKVLSLNDTSN